MLIPLNCKITKIIIRILDITNSSSYPNVFVMSNNSIGFGKSNTQNQSYDMNVILIEGNTFHVRVLNDKAKLADIDKCLVSVLLETF